MFFIKNVVAVAAYIRLASRSQAKFQNNEIESHSGFRAQPHLRRARYPPVVHFNSHLVYRCESDTHCPSGLSQAFSKQETKLVGGCLPRLSVGRKSGRFSTSHFT